jgi:hypothetical protein
MADQPSAGFLKAIKAVLWSFLGVRKSSAHRADLASLNPLHVIVAAVLCAAVFIGVLIVVVHSVTSK